jgi:hypothetical protein
VVGGVTVGLDGLADLLASGAGRIFDQVVAVVVDVQGGLVDLHGGDLSTLLEARYGIFVATCRSRRAHDSIWKGPVAGRAGCWFVRWLGVFELAMQNSHGLPQRASHFW